MSSATTVDAAFISGELVPGAINASVEREGGYFPRQPKVAGSTVNDEGLVNNYAVYPAKYAVTEPSDDVKFRQGVMFAIATWVPIAIAYFVS